MKPHFLARLAEDKGPPPAVELRSILEQAHQSPDRTAWFATRTPGREWDTAPSGGTSIAIIFHARTTDQSVDVVVAKLLARREQIPDDSIVRDLYAGHDGFNAWWRLAEPFAARLSSLDAIPGTSREGRTARQAFVGHLAFAYWEFNVFDLVVDLLQASGRVGAPRADLEGSRIVPRIPASWADSSPEQRAESIRRWAAIERPHTPPPPDEALLRESIYD